MSQALGVSGGGGLGIPSFRSSRGIYWHLGGGSRQVSPWAFRLHQVVYVGGGSSSRASGWVVGSLGGICGAGGGSSSGEPTPKPLISMHGQK